MDHKSASKFANLGDLRVVRDPDSGGNGEFEGSRDTL